MGEEENFIQFIGSKHKVVTIKKRGWCSGAVWQVHGLLQIRINNLVLTTNASGTHSHSLVL